MNKKLKIAYIVLVIILVKLLFNFVGMNYLIKKYENGEYLRTFAKSFLLINIPEGYVPRYNLGNIYYQDGNYEKAIKEYKKALSYDLPERKECSIRINYALALCKTVELDEEDQNSINKAISIYESAINVLVEDDCATKLGLGHSPTAEQLRKDIQAEIDRLKSQKSSSSKDDNKDDDQKENQDDKTDDEVEEIEKKLKDIKEDALLKQTDYEKTIDNLNNMQDLFLHDSNKKNW